MKKKLIISISVNLIMFFASLRADFNENLQNLIMQKPPEWMLEQINKDLEIYKERGISQKAIDRSMQAKGNEHSVRYKIQSQHISYTVNDKCAFLEGRRNQILEALKKLTGAVQLPDVDIIINPHDAAFFNSDSSIAPVLVFSKNKYINNQVLIPDLDALSNYGGITNEILTSIKRHPWNLKKERAFWRGATTGGSFHTTQWHLLPRAKLVLLSLQHPKLIDAKFSFLVQGAESNPAMLSMPQLKGDYVTQADSLKYKYLIDVDGNTCSWQRMYWTMLSNSVLLKQTTDNVEWYYGQLIPYEHYIPVKQDLSDLIEKINWARKNDRVAHNIAKNASQFAKEHLNEEMIYLYLYWVLVRYAELQKISTDMQTTPKEQTTMNIRTLVEEAKRDKEGFWNKQAECLDWFQRWDKVLEWNPPYAQWFIGGKLNPCYNCLDRHLNLGNKDKTALLWEGERGESVALSYAELYESVNRFSNVLKSQGIKKGDCVAIYMPMVPEAVIAMLSCARIGAVHTVVFGGFSADALKDRILDAEAKLVITADGGFRRGSIIPLKEAVDLALASCPCVKNVIVVKHACQPINMLPGRDHWYAPLMEQASDICAPEIMDAEDRLFILYTSGTTGKPKGIVHTCGGYMVGTTLTTKWVFDIRQSDVYWCTADIGWITGHSYVVYGPLSNGMTQFIYEGAPDWPQRDRFWSLINKYGITILYTAPTAIRTFMKWGIEWLEKHDLSSLRLLGSVGEPINPEAWNWYHTHVGNGNCPIVDTWWQTETGSIMISPIPGITPLKPGSATQPLPGIDVAILNPDGSSSSSGLLAITSPWPSMLRGIHNDPERFKQTYWSKWDGKFYFTGDGAMIDEDGYFWLTGRSDDVIKVSGHRIGSAEIESALVDYPSVAEAAVIGVDDTIKGHSIVAFVTVKEGKTADKSLEDILKGHVVKKIGALARPERIIFICELPKTRSGKIMRRLLRDIAEGRVLGDTTTLSDPGVINDIKNQYQDE